MEELKSLGKGADVRLNTEVITCLGREVGILEVFSSFGDCGFWFMLQYACSFFCFVMVESEDLGNLALATQR